MAHFAGLDLVLEFAAMFQRDDPRVKDLQERLDQLAAKVADMDSKNQDQDTVIKRLEEGLEAQAMLNQRLREENAALVVRQAKVDARHEQALRDMEFLGANGPSAAGGLDRGGFRIEGPENWATHSRQDMAGVLPTEVGGLSTPFRYGVQLSREGGRSRDPAGVHTSPWLLGLVACSLIRTR